MERSFSSAPIESVSVPMWVVKASTLLLFDTMPCHEELAEKGLLVRLQEGMFCIFVSHQWLGTFHPDPTGEQLRVLQDALRNLMRGEQIGTDITLEFWLQSVRLSEMHRSKLKDAYIWLDWLSIPQQDAERGNHNSADELGTAQRFWRFARTATVQEPRPATPTLSTPAPSSAARSYAMDKKLHLVAMARILIPIRWQTSTEIARKLSAASIQAW
ncbi:unnamed protein product [Effrenium voratum]|uniref:Uncharacterized protein n=1 Tax=Effrenium voratum TaxID=2562239 RepID=A0AA36HVC4_9DINO|nr:unnamed protein product [Effrenium voratum]